VFASTREQPILEIISSRNYPTFSDYQSRKITPDVDNGTFSMYLIENSSQIQNWQFTIQDFIGNYREDGRLRLKKNVNGTLQTIYSVPWEFQTLTGIYLNNLTDYLIEVYIPNTITLSFGWITVTGDGSKVLATTTPVISSRANHWKGIEYEFMTDYPTQTVGMVYNVTTGGTNNVVFKVYNSSNSLLYTNTLTTDAGVFSYTVPYNNASYYSIATFDVQNHSVYEMNQPMRLDHTYTTIAGYSWTGIAAVLGYSETQVKSFAAWILLSIIALSATAVQVGVFALLFAMATAVLYAFNMIDSSYLAVVIFTFIVAIVVKIAADRQQGFGE
jgi:hypothetical protein